MCRRANYNRRKEKRTPYFLRVASEHTPQSQFAALFLAVILFSVLSLPGCGGSRLGTVPVKGKVTINGQPVTKGTVFFQPVDATKGRPARSALGPDGAYEASSLDNDRGIVPGEYKVSLMPPATETGNPATQASISAKYRNVNTSGLTLTVPDRGGPVVYDIEMSK